MLPTKKSDLITPRRSGLLLPPRFRERRPPKMSATGKLSGYVSWRLERGGKVIAGGDQPNLITNAGLDNFALNDSIYFDDFRYYGKVGEGSVEPDITDTTLGSEVQQAVGSIDSAANTDTVDSGTNTQTSTARHKYIFDFAAPYNLTEFGLAPQYVPDLSVRQLFRNDLGDPITITVLANDRLTLYHTLEITFGPVGANVPASIDIDEYDRAGTLLGTTTMQGWCSFSGYGTNYTSTSYGQRRLAGIAPAATVPSNSSYAYIPTTQQTGVNISIAQGTTESHSAVTYESYLAGSYRKEKRYPFTENHANREWFGLGVWLQRVTGSSGYGSVLQIVFDGASANPSFTKANTHTFEVATEVTWARAA